MADIAYTPTTWADLPSTMSPINQTRLNNLETGVVAATGQANAALRAVGLNPQRSVLPVVTS